MTAYKRDLIALETLLDAALPAPLAASLVDHFGDLRRLLTSPRHELGAAGLSPEVARRIGAVRQLARALLRPRRRRPLVSPRLVVRMLPHLTSLRVEEVWALPVDGGLRPLGRVLVARGCAASCAVTPAEILGIALRSRACGVFVVHNHPSGDPSPSPSDVAFTERLLEAAKLLSVRIEDHLVVAGGRFTSVLTRRRGELRLPRPKRSRSEPAPAKERPSERGVVLEYESCGARSERRRPAQDHEGSGSV